MGCLFQLKIGFWPSGSPSYSQTLHFSLRFFDDRFGENRPKQREHRIRQVVAMGRIRQFLDSEPYRHLHLPPHVSPIIFRFSTQPDS
jgi:hypothetical protein